MFYAYASYVYEEVNKFFARFIDLNFVIQFWKSTNSQKVWGEESRVEIIVPKTYFWLKVTWNIEKISNMISTNDWWILNLMKLTLHLLTSNVMNKIMFLCQSTGNRKTLPEVGRKWLMNQGSYSYTEVDYFNRTTFFHNPSKKSMPKGYKRIIL